MNSILCHLSHPEAHLLGQGETLGEAILSLSLSRSLLLLTSLEASPESTADKSAPKIHRLGIVRCKLVSPMLRRQENQEFEANLGYMKPCIKSNNSPHPCLKQNPTFLKEPTLSPIVRLSNKPLHPLSHSHSAGALLHTQKSLGCVSPGFSFGSLFPPLCVIQANLYGGHSPSSHKPPGVAA